MILLDTGPLVALFDRDDHHHEACKETLEKLREPLVTTWPVITEAMYLLDFSDKAQDLCLEFIQSGGALIEGSDGETLKRIRELMKQYHDLPMDFADASLVSLSEQIKTTRIFTLDRKDFRIYKTFRGKSFILIPEELRS